MLEAIKKFKESHADLFEFIMFNLLSNIATITNFAVLNLGITVLFAGLMDRPFSFWIITYTMEDGGMGYFLAYFLSYLCAQVVNFIVQRKLVFNSNNKLGVAIPIYVVALLIVYIICLYIPSIVKQPISSIVGELWGANLTNVINIIVQVIILYPVLKFVVMKKVTEDTGIIE